MEQQQEKQETAVKVEEKQDLVTRVSQFKQEAPKTEEEKGVMPLDQVASQFKTVNEAVEWAKNKEKEWSSGYGKKFQELAEERKLLEQNKGQSNNWTPERIKETVNNPEFKTAAQMYMESLPKEDDTSMLSEEEIAANKRMELLQSEINNLKQQNYSTVLKQQDATLKGKYANYDPQAIDKLYEDMAAGRVHATREDFHKVIDYNAAVQRAFELGRQEEKGLKQEKVNAFSFDKGVTTNKQTEFESTTKASETPGLLAELYKHKQQEEKESQQRK